MKQRMNKRMVGDGIALITGGLLPLAFAPYQGALLAILSPALLFWLWLNCSPKRALWRGWLYGIGLFSIGVSWIHASIYQFGGVPLVGAIALTILFVTFMGLYFALLGWFVTRFFPKTNTVKLLLVLPASWTLIEWFRGWFLSGFPWLSLGYSQIDSPLSGFAPVLGVYGVTWLTAFLASVLVYSWAMPAKKVTLAVAVLSIVIIVGLGKGLSQHTWTQAKDKPINVALIQGNIPQEFKWTYPYIRESLERYLNLSQQHRDANLIIWPETAIPHFYEEVPDFIALVEQEHTDYHTDFLIGMPVGNYQQYYNGLVNISEKNSFYFKQHLVPFGEYIPLQDQLGELLKILHIPMASFTPGQAHQANLIAADEPLGISICYEDAFGELVRQSLPEATLLVNVSNDGWFGDSIAPHQHLEIARMRALETGRYLLRATNTGISAIIDPKGKITQQAAQFKLTGLSAIVYPAEGNTPYILFGNSFVIILLCVVLTFGIIYTVIADRKT